MNTKRLKKLLKIGEKILAEELPFGFGAEKFDCGTYACLGGYYARATRGGAKLRHLDRLADHFEITYDDSRRLFGTAHETGAPYEANDPGPEAYTELRTRLLTVRNWIESSSDTGASR